jgi:hypothetical protein
MTTSASLLTPVYRTQSIGTNVRQRHVGALADVKRRERSSQLQTRGAAGEAHLCTDGLVALVGGDAGGDAGGDLEEIWQRRHAPELRDAPLYNGANRLYYGRCDIVPLGISASSGAVDVVVELSPAYPFSLARGTV